MILNGMSVFICVISFTIIWICNPKKYSLIDKLKNGQEFQQNYTNSFLQPPQKSCTGALFLCPLRCPQPLQDTTQK